MSGSSNWNNIWNPKLCTTVSVRNSHIIWNLSLHLNLKIKFAKNKINNLKLKIKTFTHLYHQRIAMADQRCAENYREDPKSSAEPAVPVATSPRTPSPSPPATPPATPPSIHPYYTTNFPITNTHTQKIPIRVVLYVFVVVYLNLQ